MMENVMPTVIYHYTYIIKNITNQMQYIGVRSCSCLPENDSDYMGSSKPLDEAMGIEPEAFTKTIIDTFPTRDIANRNEQRLHEMYDVTRNPDFYNQMNAPLGFCNAGKTHSAETKKKMSASHDGKTLSPETRKKISKSSMGKTISTEARKKMSIAQMGKTLSPETRTKMSKAQMGKTLSEEHKKKLFDSNMGKKHSPETRKKMRENHVGMKGKKHSDATKKKISESSKKRKKNYEMDRKRN